MSEIHEAAKSMMMADAGVDKVRVLREALNFYANAEIYEPHPHGPAFERRDLSQIARAALAATDGTPPETHKKGPTSDDNPPALVLTWAELEAMADALLEEVQAAYREGWDDRHRSGGVLLDPDGAWDYSGAKARAGAERDRLLGNAVLSGNGERKGTP